MPQVSGASSGDGAWENGTGCGAWCHPLPARMSLHPSGGIAARVLSLRGRQPTRIAVDFGFIFGPSSTAARKHKKQRKPMDTIIVKSLDCAAFIVATVGDPIETIREESGRLRWCFANTHENRKALADFSTRRGSAELVCKFVGTRTSMLAEAKSVRP